MGYWVLRFVLFGLLATIIAFLLLVDFGHADSDATSAIKVFEAHSLALDEGRYDDAEELLDCPQTAHVRLREVSKQLERYGGFVGTYPVVGEWVHSAGEYIILDLAPPPGSELPTIQPMVKIDGEWLLNC